MMNTVAKSMQLKQNLMMLRQGDKSVSTYYNEVKGMYDQLAEIGDSVSAKEKVLYCVQNGEYQALVDSLGLPIMGVISCRQCNCFSSFFLFVSLGDREPFLS